MAAEPEEISFEYDQIVPIASIGSSLSNEVCEEIPTFQNDLDQSLEFSPVVVKETSAKSQAQQEEVLPDLSFSNLYQSKPESHRYAKNPSNDSAAEVALDSFEQIKVISVDRPKLVADSSGVQVQSHSSDFQNLAEIHSADNSSSYLVSISDCPRVQAVRRRTMQKRVETRSDTSPRAATSIFQNENSLFECRSYPEAP